jgi:hypothetical protein
MEYTWEVTDMKTLDADGVENAVVQTYWKKTGINEKGDEGVFSGATPFPVSSIDPEKFIPYDQLTEAEVLGWIQTVVVGSYEEHVNAQIQKQIDAKNIQDPGLPWGTPPTPTPTPPEPVVEAKVKK